MYCKDSVRISNRAIGVLYGKSFRICTNITANLGGYAENLSVYPLFAYQPTGRHNTIPTSSTGRRTSRAQPRGHHSHDSEHYMCISPLTQPEHPCHPPHRSLTHRILPLRLHCLTIHITGRQSRCIQRVKIVNPESLLELRILLFKFVGKSLQCYARNNHMERQALSIVCI